MASVRRRGATWQVQIRRRGLPLLTRTFRLKAEAELWARQREAEIDRGCLPVDTRVLRSHTLTSLLERYRDTVTVRKRGAERELFKLRVLLAAPIARLSLDRLTAAEIAAYRDQRLAVVKADTVRRELAILHHCLRLAAQEWGITLPSNPVSRPRERRAAPAELEKLLASAVDRAPWLSAMIRLAVETGMRTGELARYEVGARGP